MPNKNDRDNVQARAVTTAPRKQRKKEAKRALKKAKKKTNRA
jgi:hypothetical protein